MIKLFFSNLFKGVLINIGVAIVGLIFSFLVLDLVVITVLKIEISSCLPYIILSAVVGVATGLICGGISLSEHSDLYFGDPFFDKPPHAFFVYLELLIVVAILAGIPIFVICNYCGQFNIMMMQDGDWTFLFSAIGGFAGGAVSYWISLMIGYAEEVCVKCGHIFCLGKSLTDTDTEQTTQYKTETENKKVGSVKLDGIELFEVNADIKSGYYRDVKKTNYHYNCNCGYCNAKFKQTQSKIEYGDWK